MEEERKSHLEELKDEIEEIGFITETDVHEGELRICIRPIEFSSCEPLVIPAEEEVTGFLAPKWYELNKESKRYRLLTNAIKKYIMLTVIEEKTTEEKEKESDEALLRSFLWSFVIALGTFISLILIF